MSPSDDSETHARPSDGTAAQAVDSHASSSARFTPGELLAGRYRIIAPLGKGGMGEVYRADDTRLGQPVALKFLPAAFASDPGKLERLVDEVRIGRQIAHPNVCRLYDIAEAEGHHFMVMEYVDGEDLASLLRRIGRLPGDKALEIARGICAGLAAAHDKGIIHRDLKPANVMIDGRGHARIADFGLAALADGGAVADMSGTPHYMAPEQLSGQGASLRSDVFALGLVMREMLTGKRVFEAKSLNELRALHIESKPQSLSSSAADVDPGLERVVQRCLSRDPNDRPPSARAVLAALPGGDPLQAAVLAGETPSPEMVAAASKVGDLQPSVAWACLITGLIGLAIVANLASRVALYQVTPLAKPPEALVERGKEVLARLGYGEAPGDEAYGFEVDRGPVDHVRGKGDSPDWWQRLSTIRPGPYYFYYRQSPEKLWSRSWILTLPNLGPAELGRVTRTDPPPNAPGMKEVILDAKGRLRRFVAVPPRLDVPSASALEPDWSGVIAEAGFDPATLRKAQPRFAAPVDTDFKAAWDGVDPDETGTALHFEAASYRGRPVYFEVQGPWVQTPRPAAPRRSLPLLAGVAFGVFLLAVSVATPVLVRRNLGLGRGDRRGALRLGTFGFVMLTLAQLFGASHTSEALPQFHLILQIVGQGLSVGVGVWLAYLAMEPSVRRRWPNALISWSRLLAGRFRDPIVGRDVLVGVLGGLALIAEFSSARLIAIAIGATPLPPQVLTTTLSSPWHMAFYFFLSPVVAIVQSLLLLFFLYLLHRLVGRAWGAYLIFGVLFMLVALGTIANRETSVIFGFVFATILPIFLVFLLRFGLLTSTVFLFTFYVLARTPFTLDWSDWYAGRCFFVLGFFALLMAASFYTSLGGKPLFGKTLVDD